MHKALEKGDPRHEYIVGCKSCRCARFFSYRSLPCRTLACESTSVSGRLDFCVEEKQKHAQERPASVHCLDEDMKIPWKEANEGSPVPDEQYQERFWRRRLDGIGLDTVKKEFLAIEFKRTRDARSNYVERATVVAQEQYTSLLTGRRASPAPFFLADCGGLSVAWVSCWTLSVGWRPRC